MSESLWGKQGATLSHKNACKEFGLTEDEVIEAIKKGKLQYRQNYAHAWKNRKLNCLKFRNREGRNQSFAPI
jgi:hypothetical protein